MQIDEFIERWRNTQASGRDRYVFEADALLLNEDGQPSVGSMDLYRAGCFVLEAKQGSEKVARRSAPQGAEPQVESRYDRRGGQAFGYARTLDEPPPFVIVADIGNCFDLYACFDQTGAYRAFPNAQKNRLPLKDLVHYLDKLLAIWLDAYSLDPARHAEKVTREVAASLAALVLDLERAGHSRDVVEKFVMRCILTVSAEDIGLLRDDVFKSALRHRPQTTSRKVSDRNRLQSPISDIELRS